jgi:hypothetical protein
MLKLKEAELDGVERIHLALRMDQWRLFRTECRNFDFHKVQFISWLDKGPLNAHEGFWFID